MTHTFLPSTLRHNPQNKKIGIDIVSWFTLRLPMGNLCCTNHKESKSKEQDNRSKLIDREAYRKITILVDQAIINSNILSLIKQNIKNPNITEFNFILNLLLEGNRTNDIYDSSYGYGTIIEKLKENDLRFIFTQRILPELRKITEANGYSMIISCSKINHILMIQDGFDTSMSTIQHSIHISPPSNSESPETPGIYDGTSDNRRGSSNSSSNKGPSRGSSRGKKEEKEREKEREKEIRNRGPHIREQLFLKIIKYNPVHQYDSDIIYQTESKNYFRIKECIICYERLSNVLYLGCMHLQLCDKCHGNIKDPNYDPTLEGRRNCAVCSLWTGHKDLDWLIIDSKVLEKKYPVNATSHCSENDLVGLDV